MHEQIEMKVTGEPIPLRRFGVALLRRAAGMVALLFLALLNAPMGFAAPAPPPSRPPLAVANADRIHAIIIGIDQYQHLAPLKGAVADALDIEESLREMGARDINALLNDRADRDSIEKTIKDVEARIRPGDLVILSIAGHGAQEPERVKGSEPDGKDAVFLLAGFDTASGGTRQRIFDKEFNHFIKDFESRGAKVVFVADACSGGGLAREVDPRGSEMIYRSVPAYTITDDELKPVSTPSDAFATELDFTKTIFLAAVDKNSKAPEIKVPGVDGYRGALSYAFARALDGAADSNGDGKITIEKLFSYVREVTYQLSDERQTIVSASAPSLNIDTEPVIERTRSVTIVAPPGVHSTEVAANVTVGLAPGAASIAGRQSAAVDSSDASRLISLRPVRIAVYAGSGAQLAGVAPLETKFEVVAPNQNPDLIWDPRTGDVLSGGDVVAREINKEELPGVIDRAAAVRALKKMAEQSPQSTVLLPNSKVHHLGSEVEVAMDGVSDRTLLLFDLAGDGTVQLLYPQNENETRLISRAQYRLPIKVRAPFGADQIVAITAPKRMIEFEQALQRINGRRASGQLIKLLASRPEAGVRVGSVGVFTAP